jgi:CheY-like chemotaxis protein
MMVMAPVDETAPPADFQAGVGAIYRAAYHLSSLIDDVLDLSEIDADQLGLQKEWSCLGDTIGQATAAASGLFPSRGLSLEVDVPADLPPIYADRTRIRQVILNLLKNAARFTDAGGVTVSASVRDHDVVVAVSDTGIGIAPDDLPHVFDEFLQVDPGGIRRSGGNGLGLTISKKFVEMHGGSMWLESRPGLGTTFYFSLPLCTNVAANARRPWDSWVRPELLVGTEPGTLVAVLSTDQQAVRLLQRYLDGYRLVQAPDLAAIQRIATAAPLQAVIVIQPHGDEDEHDLRPVLASLPSVPVIACSVRTTRSLARGLGVADYLVKPVDRERVARALAELGEVERVLVVEDEPEMASLLAAMIRSLSPSHRAWIAHSGEEALDLIEEHRPQAVLLDLLLPGIGGQDVLRQLRAREELREIPVIVVTAGVLAGEGATTDIRTISRGDGLTTGELLRCLRSALDSLLAPSGTPRGQPVALAG